MTISPRSWTRASLLLCVGLSPLATAAVRVTPVWRMGTTAITSNIVAADVTGDGVPDLVGCGGTAPVVVTRDGAGGYRNYWTGTDVGCRSVAVADSGSDGTREIFVATARSWGPQSEPRLYVYRVTSLTPVLSGPALPEDLAGIAAGDVDGDGALELVTVSSTTAWVVNAQTLAIEWTAAGKGGTSVAIGNVDGDSAPEIIINSNPAHILSAVTQTEEWSFLGGFGHRIAAGDADGDGRDEIFASSTTGWEYAGFVRLFDPDTSSFTWTTSASPGIDAIGVADVDGDGKMDVLGVDNQWGEAAAYSGLTGARIWSVANPGSGGTGIAASDFDGDGALEIAWGSGWTFVTSQTSSSVEWRSDDGHQPIGAIGDPDGDGQEDVVIVSVLNSYLGVSTKRIFSIYQRLSRLRQNAIEQLYSSYSPVTYGVLVAQMDADAAHEIATAVAESSPYIQWHDGITGLYEGDSSTLPVNVTAMVSANVDGDAHEELIAAFENGYVWVFDGRSRYLQWVSERLDGVVQGLAVADVSGDGAPDIVALSDEAVYVFAAPSFGLIETIDVTGGKALAVRSAAAGRAGQIFVSSMPSFYSDHLVLGYELGNDSAMWECTVERDGNLYLSVIELGRTAALAGTRGDGRMDVFTLGAGSPCASVQRFAIPAGVAFRRSAARVSRTAAELITSGNGAVQIDRFSALDVDRDLDGNSTSDVVVQSGGSISAWRMNGASASPEPVGAAGAFEVVGVADFDGDTRADLLLRDPESGQIRMWLMNGSDVTSDALVGNPGLDYEIDAAADFDGDGRADIILRSGAGVIGMWRMNGPYVVDGAYVGTLPPGYSIVGADDFDADGKADLLLEDATGAVGMWRMNGSSISGGSLVGHAPGYSVVAAADYSSDGRADILLRDSAGRIGLWIMNGSTIAGGAFVGFPGGFEVAGSGDYDGDGGADILLRNEATGDVGVWLMDASAIRAGAYVGTLPPSGSIR